jgi:hypothetical protein
MLGSLAYRFSEWFNDWRLGIRTTGLVMPDDFGAGGDGCHAYLALSYRDLRRVLGRFRVRPGVDVFVDYGSGMGRVPIVAALKPFRRCIGVELSASLTAIARDNAQRAQPKLQCPQVEMVAADAREFPVPDDATCFYFFMPFHAPILAEVLRNLHRSVQAHPRDVTILYVRPVTGSTTLASVLPELPWLSVVGETALGSHAQLTEATILRP